MADPVKGACNCGTITISVPKASFPSYCVLCHCINCRTSSCSLYVSPYFPILSRNHKKLTVNRFSINLVTPVKDVTITGTPKVFADKDSESGNTVHRHFCGDCGTAIMSVVKENPETAYVKGGPFTRLS
jgi:hypothetical protein